MDIHEFKKRVDESGDIRGEGFLVDGVNGEAYAVVKHGHFWTRLAFSTIERYEWDVLEPIIKGTRPSIALLHYSRVVGYFSRIQNWNKSKLGELRDRRKGNYDVEGADGKTVAKNDSEFYQSSDCSQTTAQTTESNVSIQDKL